MALISCPECAREISDKALSCPHCGAPGAAAPPAQSAVPQDRVRKGLDGAWLVDNRVFYSEEDARRHAGETPPPTESPPSPPAKATPPWAYAVSALVVLFGLSMCFGGGTGSNSSAPDSYAPSKTMMTHEQALLMCQEALKRLSRDPEKASVPYVRGEEGRVVSTFRWDGGTSLMRMRNGLGLEVGVSGECSVDRSNRTFNSLTLDGTSYR